MTALNFINFSLKKSNIFRKFYFLKCLFWAILEDLNFVIQFNNLHSKRKQAYRRKQRSIVFKSIGSGVKLQYRLIHIMPSPHFDPGLLCFLALDLLLNFFKSQFFHLFMKRDKIFSLVLLRIK